MRKHAASRLLTNQFFGLFGLLIISMFAQRAAAQATSGKLLAGYFEEWSIYGANYNIANIESSGAGSKLSYLLYAFANVTTTGECGIADSWADYQDIYLPPVAGIADTAPLYGNFAELVKLKKLHSDLKILISLGGASALNTANFASAVASAATRKQLASSCIDMFIKGNIADGVSAAGLFDGIDVDWEFPVAADKQNFTALLKEFRSQLDALGAKNSKHYLLTIAAPAGQQNFSNMDLAKVAAQLDYLNLETYDYHGTWEALTN